METNQPDALRLAAILSNEFDTYTDTWSAKEAAAELRRLHAENTALQSGYEAARLEIASLQAKLAVFDSASAVRRDSTAQQGGEYPVDTGNPEANRIIGRLASSDPDFEDCVDAVALIHKLVAEHKGPAGFATWKDAAISERMRRVDAAIDTALVSIKKG